MATRTTTRSTTTMATLEPDPTRDSAAVEIARDRGYGLRQTPAGRWMATTPAGRAILLSLSDDPVLALEAAETARLAAEQQAQEHALARLVAAYGLATHFLRPRQAPPASGVWVWDVLQAGTTTVVQIGLTSVVAGMRAIELLQAPPPPPEPGP